MLRIFTLSVAALAVAPFAAGHTWIEQLRNIDDEGSYVGEYGYPRGMVGKADPGFSGLSMNWEMPAGQGGKLHIDETIVLCHPEQTKQKQSSDKYPRLQATPGGFIAMRYTENGHITLPENQKGKPEKAGTVFVYGTTEPQEDEKLVDVLQWTQDGNGGNGRGILLATNNYDDNQCYEINSSPVHAVRSKKFPAYALGQAAGDGAPGTFQRYCETDVKLPESAQIGKPYTFYWVWQWNTAAGGADPTFPKGKDEYYSTCIDVDVASPDVALAADAKPKFAMLQQDSVSKAVAGWSSRTALMTNAIEGEVGPYFEDKQPSNPGGNPSQSAPAQAPAPSSKVPTPSAQPPAQSVTRVTRKPSGQPAIPTLSRRPGAKPSRIPDNGNGPQSDSDDVVTITDTVFLTVTASNPAQTPSPAIGSMRDVTSVKQPSAKVTLPTPRPTTLATIKSSKPPVAAPSGRLPGFNMGNPNGAKFRRDMFT